MAGRSPSGLCPQRPLAPFFPLNSSVFEWHGVQQPRAGRVFPYIGDKEAFSRRKLIQFNLRDDTSGDNRSSGTAGRAKEREALPGALSAYSPTAVSSERAGAFRANWRTHMPRAKSPPIVMTTEQTAASHRARAANLRTTAEVCRLPGVKDQLLSRAAEWEQKADELLTAMQSPEVPAAAGAR